MRAVVCDFFGTLTDPGIEAGRREAFAATAALLGVPAEPFWTAMSTSFGERITGRYGHTRAMLRAMAARCGAEPSEAQLDAAAAAHHAASVRLWAPRPGALETLARLRAAGLRIGVLSDCGAELCDGWPATPYAPLVDATVFSWQEGRRKPDPLLYATAAHRLGVEAHECWFVGDGGSREHQGARDAGMRPVLVTNAGYPGAGRFRDDPDPFVPEFTIDDFPQVYRLIAAVKP
ncbi:HAD family hydrolase [Dactylosporangium sp. AC04546]|uniref:HAD family hydrolase n=1 Tax=Dactylosporangium sp. AC04546 TaxID=2862460 RepID=UPI001EE136DB|nr:HAD family hydrolase [Dactylosporangium sp. AC04546]WVK87950.1 HAD family hydrolase [Dactylosporangium sp. AC04546]